MVSLRPGRLSLRARSAVAAAVAVTLVLAIGIAGFAWVLRWSGEEQVRSVARTTAEVMADRVALDGVAVVADYDGDSLIQVLDAAGRVVAAGQGASGYTMPTTTGPATLGGERFYVQDRAVDGSELRVVVAQEYDDDASTRRTALISLVAISPLMVVLIGILAWVATSRALRPVAQIGRELESIDAGDVHRRVDVPATHDEIADLAATMNRLLDRFESGVQAQRRFVADASHELRSPLAALRQYAELATSHPDDLAPGELAEVVGTASLRLQSLIDDLLVLATTAEGQSGPRAEVDLDDVVLTELSAFRAANVTLDASGVRAVKVAAHERRLAMVVRNLVANAMRHAQHRVRVATGQDDAGAWLVVTDDGPGVPPADRERIFERFVRLDEGRDRDAGGSGLGLAIVAAIVTDTGGSVVVDEAPAGGARFTVRLPLWPS